MLAKDGFAMGMLNKHYKSQKFNKVLGGTQIAFRGGWSTGTAAVSSVHMRNGVFVLADLRGGFGQLVFGRKRSTAEERAKVNCIAGLQKELRNKVTSATAQCEVVNEPLETDLMGDATMTRGLAEAQVKTTRNERRRFSKAKKQVQQRPLEGKIVSVRFPRKPGQLFADDFVNVTCLQQTNSQRPSGVWVRREDLPWLVGYAAMEVAQADGEELFPDYDTVDHNETPKYCVGLGAGNLTWTSLRSTHMIPKYCVGLDY